MAAVTGDDELYLPIGIDRLEVYRPGATSGLCRMRLQPASNAETLSADFEITSEAGSVIAAGSGLHIKRPCAARSTYEFRWESGPGVSAPRLAAPAAASSSAIRPVQRQPSGWSCPASGPHPR